MNRSLFLGFLVLSAILVSSGHTVSAQGYQPALTEHGQPDLRGVWNFTSSAPLERPERYGEIEFLSDIDNANLDIRSTRTPK